MTDARKQVDLGASLLDWAAELKPAYLAAGLAAFVLLPYALNSLSPLAVTAWQVTVVVAFFSIALLLWLSFRTTSLALASVILAVPAAYIILAFVFRVQLFNYVEVALLYPALALLSLTAAYYVVREVAAGVYTDVGGAGLSASAPRKQAMKWLAQSRLFTWGVVLTNLLVAAAAASFMLGVRPARLGPVSGEALVQFFQMSALPFFVLTVAVLCLFAVLRTLGLGLLSVYMLGPWIYWLSGRFDEIVPMGAGGGRFWLPFLFLALWQLNREIRGGVYTPAAESGTAAAS